MSAFGTPSPSYYRGLRRAITDFRDPYVEYINETAGNVYAGERVIRDARRADLVRKAVLAGEAVSKTGIVIGWTAPPVMSAPPLVGLANVAFAHESPIYRGLDEGLYLRGATRPYETVIDALDSADAIFQEQLRRAERQRKSPFYWGDRILRALLGFPAYLLSLLVGFDRRSLSKEAERALWWLSIAADVAGIYALGLATGWW